MKTLEFEKMEIVDGGSCGAEAVSLGLSIVRMALATGIFA